LIRVGTRASALALAQAVWVAQRLGEDTQLVRVTTAGDRGLGRSDKSRWVSELERALLGDEIDVAVHSAKDVPAELPEGLELVAIPVREDPRDAICGAPSLDELPSGARVGTSSLRRTAQLRARRADLEVVPVRGNVDTRLAKLAAGEYEALVLARAGLDRLGLGGSAQGTLDELVPAAGQGALALEARPGRLPPARLTTVNDPDTHRCVQAERDVVRALGASCNTPVGVHAASRGEELVLSAWLGLTDGSHWIADQVMGPGDHVAGALVERLEAVGAMELLRAAERAAQAGSPERSP
jgi:hydroxymethylbilane synthase